MNAELTEPPLPRLTLRRGGTLAETPKRRMQREDPFRWRLRKRVGQWLFWRFGIAVEPIVCPAPVTGGTLVGWYFPGGASFIIRLSADRGRAVLMHRMRSFTFGPTEGNARLTEICDRLLAGEGGDE